MIGKVERIEVNGFTWFWQEFTNPDGKLEAIRLYAGDGDFVTEFGDYREMIYFLNGVIECEEGAVIIGVEKGELDG